MPPPYLLPFLSGVRVLQYCNFVPTNISFTTSPPPRGLSVRLGDYDVGTANEHSQYPHYEVKVSRVVVHPHFNKATLANDVALLKLSQPINLQQYSHVTPACIPNDKQLFTGQRCVLVRACMCIGVCAKECVCVN